MPETDPPAVTAKEYADNFINMIRPSDTNVKPSIKSNAFDNKSFYRAVFGEGKVYKDLFLRNATIFKDKELCAQVAPVIYALSHARAAQVATANSTVWFITESMLPGIDDSYYMSTSAADKFLNANWSAIFVASVARDYCSNTKPAWDILKNVTGWGDLPSEPPTTLLMASTIPLPTGQTVQIAFGVMIAYLSSSEAEVQKKVSSFRRKLAGYVASVVVSITKQGTFTDRWYDRFSNRLSSEYSGLEILGREDIATLADNAKPIFSSKENAKELFVRLQTWAKDLSLPITLQVTLERTIYHGITTYRLIMTALAEYNDFPWEKINKAFGEEFTKFYKAFENIGYGEYEGYTNDMDAVWHKSKFPILGWISRKLLMKMNPMAYGGLKDLRGFDRGPATASKIEDMIEEYYNSKTIDFEKMTISEDDKKPHHKFLDDYKKLKPVEAIPSTSGSTNNNA